MIGSYNPIDLAIQFVLVLIMFGIGASLKFKDFNVFFRHPRAIVIGLIMQMIWLPVVSFFLVSLWDIPAELKAGIMIMSLCPGGVTSNFISYILKLDTALSITLTTINSIIILFTIPLGTNWILQYYMGSTEIVNLPIVRTGLIILFLTFVPAIIGVCFNSTFQNTGEKVQKYLKGLNILLLGGVFLVKIFADPSKGGSGINGHDLQILLPVLLAIHISSIITTFFISRYTIHKAKNAVTIAIEVALQNTTLTLVITSTMLGNEIMGKPALIVTLFTFTSTFIFGYLMKRFFVKYK